MTVRMFIDMRRPMPVPDLFAFAREHPGLFADGDSLSVDTDSEIFPFG